METNNEQEQYKIALKEVINGIDLVDRISEIILVTVGIVGIFFHPQFKIDKNNIFNINFVGTLSLISIIIIPFLVLEFECIFLKHQYNKDLITIAYDPAPKIYNLSFKLNTLFKIALSSFIFIAILYSMISRISISYSIPIRAQIIIETAITLVISPIVILIISLLFKYYLQHIIENSDRKAEGFNGQAIKTEKEHIKSSDK